jgi:hypothetical protein
MMPVRAGAFDGKKDEAGPDLFRVLRQAFYVDIRVLFANGEKFFKFHTYIIL